MWPSVDIHDKNRGIIIPQKITEDLAYLCGVFAGDGSIGFRPKKYEYCLKVVGNPKDEIEFYHQVIGPKFEKVFGTFPRMKYHDSKTTYGFSIYSKTICLYLTTFIGLPLGVKYSKLKIPEIFLKDRKFIIAFIRGSFDTDGCISFKKTGKKYAHYPCINLTSKSANFIKQIADELNNLDLKFSETYNYNQRDPRIERGFTTVSRIDIHGHNNLNIWMDRIGFFSPKHLAKVHLHS